VSQVFCCVFRVFFGGVSLKSRDFSRYQLMIVISLKAVPEMEKSDEIVFGRTDDGPLSQSCPVCKCINNVPLYSVYSAA
jgi:hypothetical protein